MDKKIFNDNSIALKKDIRGKTYNSLQEALNDELLVRDIGVTVKILNDNEVVEYWWESDITDAGLVKKVSESILISPNGTKFLLSVNDEGILITTIITE